MEKLNLGCGKTHKQNYINLDYNRNLNPKPDIIYDLNKIPWKPFKSNQFREIIASHILEHFPNPLEIFEEMYRISKNEGIIKIRVPHWSHYFAYTDVTHKTFFSINSLRLFDENSIPDGCYYDRKFRFKVISIKYNASLKFLRKYVNKILNMNPILTENFLCKIIPIKELIAEFEVLK